VNLKVVALAGREEFFCFVFFSSMALIMYPERVLALLLK
jgi:hypothetical protein